MLYNNKLWLFINVFYLIVFSPLADASGTAPALAGTWVSVLPPVLTIAVALLTKRVVPALFVGIWTGLLDSFQVYVLGAMADRDHTAIVLFSMMIGGMVGIISRNGGMQGIVNLIVRWVDSARHASVSAAALGVAIFFDDYSNTLVVGNTMRPLTDKMRVSREKLAYIVDSTAAPVACIAVVTTWIGYEVGMIGDSLDKMPEINTEAYLLFLKTIPYSFYPILAVAFVFMVAFSGRDFGPMLEAERKAAEHGSEHSSPDKDSSQETESLQPVKGKPQRAVNAFIPVVVLVLGVVLGLYVTGREALGDVSGATLKDIVGAADSYRALMWASLVAMMAAALLTIGQRIMDMEEVINSWFHGVSAMLMAMIILVLAWSIGEITDVLKTADFLVGLLGDALPAFALPTLVFILAAATAFATGTSWGTMGILFPLVMPLSWAVMSSQGLTGPEHMHILYSSIASILAGAVWGDHCSPISDTTILSSLSSGCDHIAHVRTQLPYALVVGAVGTLTGSLLTALGSPWWLGILLGLVVLWLILRFYGKQSSVPRTG